MQHERDTFPQTVCGIYEYDAGRLHQYDTGTDGVRTDEKDE